MIPNNNFSCLPFYQSIEEQNARKWWLYGRIYPLFCGKSLLPFQFQTDIDFVSLDYTQFRIELFNAKTNELVLTLTDMRYAIESVNIDSKILLLYRGDFELGTLVVEGQYYLKVTVLINPNRIYYSEVFTLVADLQPYLKIEWWDAENFVMDAGTIVYDGSFKNRLYLQADLAKPEYLFEDESETRDGYLFPIKQISEKRYKFSFFASEYLLDVMRFIRMADFVEITYSGKLFKPDSFLITPEWEKEGDVASVNAEFETNTVAKKIGRAYIDTPIEYHSFNTESFDDSFNK